MNVELSSTRRFLRRAAAVALLGLSLSVPVSAQTAQLHNTAGLAKFYQGKYEEAFAEFVSALRKDPAYAAPHYNLGRLYEKQQRYDEALRQYQQCLQLDPRHEGARESVERLGYLVAPPKEEPAPETVDQAKRADLERQKTVVGKLIVDGRLDEAEERLLVLLRAFPKDGTLHSLLGRVYERKGDFGRAITELRLAAAALPSSALIAYRLASALYRVGAFDETEAVAKRVVEMDPANYRAYHLLGLLARSRDQLPEAQKYFAEAARLNPGDAKVQEELRKVSTGVGLYHFNAGLFLFTQQNWKGARDELTLAIKGGDLNPGQLAIAQQYLLIADFSAQRIDAELARLVADRKNAEQGFVQKRLTFEEVERSPRIWRQGAYVAFDGRIVSVGADRSTVVVETYEDNDYRSESSMKTWFVARLPRPLPQDPRIQDNARIEVQGKLAKPEYVRNVYNRLYSREPQPTVEATYLRIVSEVDLSGPLKIDYLSYTSEQRKEERGQKWDRYHYR